MIGEAKILNHHCNHNTIELVTNNYEKLIKKNLNILLYDLLIR